MLRTFNTWLALVVGGSLFLASPPTPLSAAVLSPPATVLRQQTSEPVYALQGTLGRAENQNFATYMLSADGVAYALVGETPAVEAEITTLRDQRVIVKVWGTLYPQGRVSATPEIVVANILAESSPPAPTPAAQPTAVVRSGIINIRTGPDTNYESIGTLNQGTRCTISGRDPANTWWQAQCETGLTGWIFQQLVDTTGNTASIPVAAVPPPTAAASNTAPTTRAHHLLWLESRIFRQSQSLWQSRYCTGHPRCQSGLGQWGASRCPGRWLLVALYPHDQL